MGIIKAVMGAVGGGFADSWLEVIEPANMGGQTLMTKGVKVRQNDKRNNNYKGTDDYISNGSIIHVYPNQAMLLMENGKIIDYTAEPGTYKVDNSSAPSLFNGELLPSVTETFNRVRFAGIPSDKQLVYFINLQEIKGIKFGTKNPVNYLDAFYNSELFLRAHGSYSIKITDPIKFFNEVIPRNSSQVEVIDVNDQFLDEFLCAFQSSLNQMSADGFKISHVTSKALELAKYMSDALDEEWSNLRGFIIQAVAVASISYDDESKALINMRNQGAMLSDPTIREGYVQGTMAGAMKDAANNTNGATNAFMGVGVGMGAAGGFMNNATAFNAAQLQQQQAQQAAQPTARAAVATPLANEWKCQCSATNTAKFCTECGAKKPESDTWVCSNGHTNTGKFCHECGEKKPEANICPKCGFKLSDGAKFCPECGEKI